MSDDLLRSVFKNITPIEQTNELEPVTTPAIGGEQQQTSSGISGTPDSIEQSSGQNSFLFNAQADGIIWQNASPYEMNQANFNWDGNAETVDIGGEAFIPVPSEFKPPEGDPLPGLDDPDPVGGQIGAEVGADAPLDFNDIINGRKKHEPEQGLSFLDLISGWSADAGGIVGIGEDAVGRYFADPQTDVDWATAGFDRFSNFSLAWL